MQHAFKTACGSPTRAPLPCQHRQKNKRYQASYRLTEQRGPSILRQTPATSAPSRRTQLPHATHKTPAHAVLLCGRCSHQTVGAQDGGLSHTTRVSHIHTYTQHPGHCVGVPTAHSTPASSPQGGRDAAASVQHCQHCQLFCQLAGRSSGNAFHQPQPRHARASKPACSILND
jgi:hypothetical protein